MTEVVIQIFYIGVYEIASDCTMRTARAPRVMDFSSPIEPPIKSGVGGSNLGVGRQKCRGEPTCSPSSVRTGRATIQKGHILDLLK